MTKNTTLTAEQIAERDALLAGLDELRRQNNYGLKPAYGARSEARKRIRVPIEVTEDEHRVISAVRAGCGMAVGRPVSMALVIRTGLAHMQKTVTASLKDPVMAAKLKADLLKARSRMKAQP